MFLANRNWEDIVRDYESMQIVSTETEESPEQDASTQSVDSSVEQTVCSSDVVNEHVTTQEKMKLKSADNKELASPDETSMQDTVDVKLLDDLINQLTNQKYEKIQSNSFDKEFLKAVPNLRILPPNANTIALQTTIRDRKSPREDFVFDSDRLIRLVIEEGLNHLPSKPKTIETPPGGIYDGVEFLKSNCGVSIVRSGEAMEKALRDCCRAIRIGKILIQSDEDTHLARVVYAKLPDNISLRKVLLLYPIMSTGNTVVKAIKLLKKNGAKEENIILMNLFATPLAIRAIASRFSRLTIQTAEIHPIVPSHFGKKYFGTD
ncbi:PREDICTED: uracil phosphoribosyltransferase homolog [Rhagoletis zephyria]|uniref:uracil phosphoribosyltransferase homolog n=1 Tax=Rhagoletis zephyria TaxID=28612 RepID=UPI0008119022|nr:PREDICTED: uracil phosphoribosyltransferase homolog [Rhagoletis zephyria]